MDDKEKVFGALVYELVEVPSDEREMEILSVLDKIAPDPEYLDYIFHSDEFYDESGNVDIEKLTRKVFDYSPINL